MDSDLKFRDWFTKNYPKGTVIDDPLEMARRIYSAMVAYTDYSGDVYVRVSPLHQEFLAKVLADFEVPTSAIRQQVDLIRRDLPK